MSQAQIVIQQNVQQNVAVDQKAQVQPIPVPCLLILHETDIDMDEKKIAMACCGKFADLDSKLSTQRLQDVFNSYPMLFVDVRNDDFKNWALEMRNYLDMNEGVVSIYIAKRGYKNAMTDERKRELKQTFHVKYVRKHLTKYASTYIDLITKISSDHASKSIVKISNCEKVMKALKCIVSAV